MCIENEMGRNFSVVVVYADKNKTGLKASFPLMLVLRLMPLHKIHACVRIDGLLESFMCVCVYL